MLNTLSIATAGNGGSLDAGGQAYTLRIYSVSGSNATFIATYVSQDAVTFTETDWLQWTGLNTPLAPDTHYAYTLHRNTAGWENGANVTGDVYAGGQAVVIPSGGGAIGFSTDSTYDAAFEVGLSVASAIAAGDPLISPNNAVTVGTQVTIGSTAVGPTPLSVQWRTDGGVVTLTNIPFANGTTLAVDTTGFETGFYRYDYIVTNSSGSVTSAPVTLTVSPAVQAAGAGLADTGTSVPSSMYDISQFTGGSGRNYDGLNYYNDNGANNNGWMGQTFTTGTNSQGYYLDSIALQTGGGGNGGGNTTTPQLYHLYIYIVNGNTAALIAHYTNANFTFSFTDWLKWSGFSLVLKPNTTYAYGFGRDATGTGWAALNSVPPTRISIQAAKSVRFRLLAAQSPSAARVTRTPCLILVFCRLVWGQVLFPSPSPLRRQALSSPQELRSR